MAAIALARSFIAFLDQEKARPKVAGPLSGALCRQAFIKPTPINNKCWKWFRRSSVPPRLRQVAWPATYVIVVGEDGHVLDRQHQKRRARIAARGKSASVFRARTALTLARSWRPTA